MQLVTLHNAPPVVDAQKAITGRASAKRRFHRHFGEIVFKSDDTTQLHRAGVFALKKKEKAKRNRSTV